MYITGNFLLPLPTLYFPVKQDESWVEIFQINFFLSDKDHSNKATVKHIPFIYCSVDFTLNKLSIQNWHHFFSWGKQNHQGKGHFQKNKNKKFTFNLPSVTPASNKQ